MIRIDQLFAYIAAIAVGWLIVWYVIYLITGFHLNTIWLSNGISINGISLTTSKYILSIGRVQLRLFGNNRRIILDDLQLTLAIDESRSSQKRKSKANSKANEDQTSPNDDHENDLNVFPAKRIHRYFLKFVLRRLSHVDIELRNTSVHDQANGSITSVDYLRFNLDSRLSERYEDTLKFKSQIIINNVTCYPMTKANYMDTLSRSTPSIMSSYPNVFSKSASSSPASPISVDTIKLQANCQIDLRQGILYRVGTKVFIDHLSIHVFPILKRLHDYFETKDENKSKNKSGSQSSENAEIKAEHFEEEDISVGSKNDDIVAKLYKLHRRLYPAIDEVSFHIENTFILDIPMVDSNKDDSIKNYLKSHSRPNLSLELSSKSVSVNYQRLKKTSPGFQVLFDPVKDNPFQLTSSIQLWKINYCNLLTLEESNRQIMNTDEILNIPQFGFIFKSNVLDHLARGEGFKNCVMEFFTSASSPVFDLDTDQLTSLVYNFSMIVKYMTLINKRKEEKEKKMRAEGTLEKTVPTEISVDMHMNEKMEDTSALSLDVEDTESDNTVKDEDTQQAKKKKSLQLPVYQSEESRSDAKAKTSPSSVKKTLLKLLHDNYPKLELKLSLEQPRFIIRHNDRPTNTVKLLNFSYSFLNIHIITTPNREYDVNCNFLHPAIDYVEKSLTTSSNEKKTIDSEIFGLKFINIKLDVLRKFKVKPRIKLEDLTVNLSDLEVLKGISSLLKEISTMLDNDFTNGLLNSKLNESLVEERMKMKKSDLEDNEATESKESSSNAFSRLPFWLLEVSFSISNILITVGSRSLFIPPKDLSDTIKNSTDFIGDNNKLRTTQLKLKKFEVLLSNESHPLNLQSSKDSNQFVFSLESSKHPNVSVESPSNFDFSDDGYTPFWKAFFKLTGLTLSVNYNMEHTYSFLSIPTIELDTLANMSEHGDNLLIVNSKIEDINTFVDRYNMFTIIGSIYLVREFILQPIKQIKERMKRDKRRTLFKAPTVEGLNIDSKEDRAHSLTKTLKLLLIKSVLSKVIVTMSLSDDFKIKLQLFDIQLTVIDGIVGMKTKLIRVLADSPTIENHWTRVLILDSLAIHLDPVKLIRKADDDDDDIIRVDCDNIRAQHPHQFVVYHLFDNLSITIKIIKHLVQTISNLKKDESEENCQYVPPSESKPLAVPPIRIKSGKICFNMEDDPFESELCMIYQLGLIEQRKRLEEYSLFDTHARAEGTSEHDYNKKLNTLHENVSRSWIRKVKVYKAKINDEIVRNKKYLFGSELSVPNSLNEDVVTYMSQAPLFAIVMEDVDIKLRAPKFPISDLPQFLYDMGQQVPKDTKYSLSLPSYVQLSLGELRIHLRDYPLPLLHVPANKDKKLPSLNMEGHVIIAENLVTAKENVRELLIPLVREAKSRLKSISGTDNTIGPHQLVLQRSLSTVKLYSDLKFKFQSESSSRFVWGQSYQFALQQTIMNFDQFSKPPVDPSDKLGVWDKLRLIIHGNFKIQVADSGDLQIAIKGSRDPYNLFGVSSGFILAFKDSVEWRINEHDDPKSFFEIVAEKVSFFVPNYLAAPLICWSRPSSKSTYLPDTKNFVSSTFGYYLEDIPSQSDVNVSNFIEFSKNVLEKNVLKLSGGINFKVGFLLERDNLNKKGKTFDSKPHYEVELFNPKFTKKGHDSYAGFRSDYIHMALSLTSNNENCNNSIHLSPGVFKLLFSWWRLFASNMMLPIRSGSLFGESQVSKKFSQHLFTNKFLFKFKSVFMSHIYRNETVDIDDDKIECIGIRAKMDEFVLDLHQRKESRILVHEGLSKNKNIKKMNFNIGQSHLRGIDLRTVSGVFDQDIYEKTKSDSKNDINFKFSTFDDDSSWFDIDDYEELFIPTLSKSKREVEINPMMYTECFSYIRDTSKKKSKSSKDKKIEGINEDEMLEDDDDLGLEDSHECSLDSENVFSSLLNLYTKRIDELSMQIKKDKKEGKSVKELQARIKSLEDNIQECEKRESEFEHQKGQNKGSKSEEKEDQENPESSQFHNRFMLISMLLKWNVENRNLLLKYIQFVHWKSSISKYLSYEAISKLQKLIERQDENLLAGDMATIKSTMSQIGSKLKTVKSFPFPGAINKMKSGSSKERLDNFDSILKNISSKDRTINEDYLIEVISPQIQLQSQEVPDSVLLITAPTIVTKIVSVVDSSNLMVDNLNVLEDRYGIIMQDANAFILNKDELNKSDNSIVTKAPYGSKENWPPWLGIEICKNGSLVDKKKVILEQISSMVIYEKIKPLGKGEENDGSGEFFIEDEEDDNDDTEGQNSRKKEGSKSESRERNANWDDQHTSVNARLSVDVPKLVVTSTAKQYSTLYIIVMTLLLYTEPMNKTLTEKLDKLRFSIDFQDLNAIHSRLVSLHKYHRLLSLLSNNYQFRQHVLDNESLNDYLSLNVERGQAAIEIYLMMQSIFSGNMSTDPAKGKSALSNPTAKWIIGADEIILHLLQDDRTPILDVAMARGRCKRTLFEDGSNVNKIEIFMMQIFNLLKTARYPDLFGPMSHDEDSENIITVDWKMNRPVGGIKFIENFVLYAKPLDVKMDDTTGKELMKYIFQSDGDISESPLLQIHNKEKDDDEESSDNQSYQNSISDRIQDQPEASNGLDTIDGFQESKDRRGRRSSKKMSESTRSDQSIAPRSSSSSGGISRNNGIGSRSGTGLGSATDDSEFEFDVEEMVSRSKRFMSIGNLCIQPLSVQISIKCKNGYMRVLNVEDFLIQLPTFEIKSQVVSTLDITLMIKKLVIKVILSHSVRLLKNKFKVRKSKSKRLIMKPLQPIKKYRSYMKATELRSSSVSEAPGKKN